MTIKQVVNKHKLDKRSNYFAYYGMVVKNVWHTTVCTGCDGDGCHECGYQGKVRGIYPEAILDKDENPIKTSSKNFTYLKKQKK